MNNKENVAYCCFLYISILSIVSIALVITLDTAGIQVAFMFGMVFIFGGVVAGVIGVLLTLLCPAEWPLSVMSLCVIGFGIVTTYEKELLNIEVIGKVSLGDFLLIFFISTITLLSFRWGVLLIYKRFLRKT